MKKDRSLVAANVFCQGRHLVSALAFASKGWGCLLNADAQQSAGNVKKTVKKSKEKR